MKIGDTLCKSFLALTLVRKRALTRSLKCRTCPHIFEEQLFEREGKVRVAPNRVVVVDWQMPHFKSYSFHENIHTEIYKQEQCLYNTKET